MTAPLETYLARFPPMQAGRLRKALTRQQGFNRRVFARHAYAESLACKPGVRVDRERRRVVTDPDGQFFDVADVTEAFADYLAWLIAEAHPLTKGVSS